MKKVLGTGSAQVIAVSVMLSLLMSLDFSLSLFIRFFLTLTTTLAVLYLLDNDETRPFLTQLLHH